MHKYFTLSHDCYRYLTGLVLLVSLLMFSVSATAKPNRYALLVGVSNYPNLDKNLQLDGPKHDVQLMESVLIEKGFPTDNIISLSENTGHTRPNRNAITGAFDRVLLQLEEGDFLFLMMAGHGSRQPAKQTDNDEPDGYDEIFLPSDANKWNDYIGSVENAITDDEIGAFVDAVRSKGTDMWVVFDSCHSGTMTRGFSDDSVRYRKVSESALGIPTNIEINKVPGANTIEQAPWIAATSINAAAVRSRGGASSSGNTNSRLGDLTVFSAAQSYETTPEMRLPRGADNARYHGLFTFSLINELSSNKPLNYRQLAQNIVARYSVLPWRNTQPLFSGTSLNKPIFNEQTIQTASSSFTAKRDKTGNYKVEAGSLHGFEKDALVALYSKPELNEENFVSKAKVQRASSLASVVKIDSQAEAADAPVTLYAVLKVPVSANITGVSALQTKGEAGLDFENLQNALATVAASEPLIAVSDQPDIRVAKFDGAIWLLKADQTLPCEYQDIAAEVLEACKQSRQSQRLLNITIPAEAENLEGLLRSAILRLAKGDNLLKLQQQLARLDTSETEVEVTVERAAAGQNYSRLSGLEVTKLKVGDSLRVRVYNHSRGDQDVSILYKDAQYGISQLYPRRGEANRLFPSKRLEFEFEVSGDTLGLENFIVLSAPSRGVASDFSFLEQPPLSVSVRGNMCIMGDLINASAAELLFANSCSVNTEIRGALTRGLSSKAKPNLGAMQVFNWTIEES